MFKPFEEYIKNPIIQATYIIPLIYSLLKSVVNRVTSIIFSKLTVTNYKNRVLFQSNSVNIHPVDHLSNSENSLEPDTLQFIYATTYISLCRWVESLKINVPEIRHEIPTKKVEKPPNYIASINSVVNRVKKLNSTFNNPTTSLSRLNFFYTNATSLVNKMSLFNSRINYLNYPHVLMLTETWFNDCSVSKIANYTLFKKN